MYTALLITHSWLRWIVLISAAVALVQTVGGMSGERRWSADANRWTLFFTVALDIQTLVGLLLYFVFSPYTQAAFANMASAMRSTTARYYVVEHVAGMVAALILAHVGRVRIRRATTDTAKYQQAVLFIGLATAAILLSIPWPPLPAGRPLFRF